MYLGQLCVSKCVLCFLIHKSYVRSTKSYCFVRKYAAIPVQLEIVILQYIIIIIIIIPVSSDGPNLSPGPNPFSTFGT